MADEKTVKYVGEINKGKNPTAVILVLVIIATILGIGMISKSCKTEPVEENVTTEKKWGLCWEDHEEKRCGIVEKIVFHNTQIIKMAVFFPSTGVTVNFFRDPNSEIGIWVQPRDKGEWTLSPTKEGGYSGKANDHKGWRAKLVVEKLISIR